MYIDNECRFPNPLFYYVYKGAFIGASKVIILEILHAFQLSVDYLFDLILYVPSTIFQLYRNDSSWVEPVLS